MKNFLFILGFMCCVGAEASALTQDYQDNPAPLKGQTICHVQYLNLVPNRTVNLDLTKNGYEVVDLEKYEVVAATYSKVGRLVIFKGAGHHVSITYSSIGKELNLSANDLAIENSLERITLNGSDHVMAKVIFKIGNFINVSCAENP